MKLKNYYLMIHHDLWKHWFDLVIKRITDYCDEILAHNEMKNGQCKYLFLVGGFSGSKYYQQQMINHYKDKHNMTIIVPKEPILSVCQGAARCGLVKTFILSRKLTKSYGVRITLDVNEIAQNNFHLDQEYIDNHSEQLFGGMRVTGLLNMFAKRGQEIGLHYKFEEQLSRVSTTQTIGQLRIFECNIDNVPQTIYDEGVSFLGYFTLEFPENSDIMDVTIEYSFDDTVLVVTAIWNDQRKRLHIEHCDSLQK